MQRLEFTHTKRRGSFGISKRVYAMFSAGFAILFCFVLLMSYTVSFTAIRFPIVQTIMMLVGVGGVLAAFGVYTQKKITVPYIAYIFITLAVLSGISLWYHALHFGNFVAVDTHGVSGLTFLTTGLVGFVYAVYVLKKQNIAAFFIGFGIVLVVCSLFMYSTMHGGTGRFFISEPTTLFGLAALGVLSALLVWNMSMRTVFLYATTVALFSVSTVFLLYIPFTVHVSTPLFLYVWGFVGVTGFTIALVHCARMYTQLQSKIFAVRRLLFGTKIPHSRAVAGAFVGVIALGSIGLQSFGVGLFVMPDEQSPWVTSSALTQKLVLETLNTSPMFGMGSVVRAVRLSEDITHTDTLRSFAFTAIPEQTPSFIVTEFIKNGIGAPIVWLLLFVVILGMGYQALRRPHIYDHGWYTAARIGLILNSFFLGLFVVGAPGFFGLMLFAVFLAIYTVACVQGVPHLRCVHYISAKSPMRRLVFAVGVGGIGVAVLCVSSMYVVAEYHTMQLTHMVTDSEKNATYDTAYAVLSLPEYHLYALQLALRQFVAESTGVGSTLRTEAYFKDMIIAIEERFERLHDEAPRDARVYDLHQAWYTVLAENGYEGSITARVENARELYLLYPRSEDYLEQYVAVLLAADKADEAYDVLTAYESKTVRVHYLTALTLGRMEQYAEALTILKEIPEDDFSFAILVTQAGMYQAAGDIDRASVTYVRVIEKYPENITGYLHLALFYVTQNDLPRARETVRLAESRFPEESGRFVELENKINTALIQQQSVEDVVTGVVQ